MSQRAQRRKASNVSFVCAWTPLRGHGKADPLVRYPHAKPICVNEVSLTTGGSLQGVHPVTAYRWIGAALHIAEDTVFAPLVGNTVKEATSLTWICFAQVDSGELSGRSDRYTSLPHCL